MEKKFLARKRPYCGALKMATARRIKIGLAVMAGILLVSAFVYLEVDAYQRKNAILRLVMCQHFSGDKDASIESDEKLLNELTAMPDVSWREGIDTMSVLDGCRTHYSSK